MSMLSCWSVFWESWHDCQAGADDVTCRWSTLVAQVARSRKYTPSQDDVGFVLKYECSIFDPNHPYIDLGRPMLAFTSRVRPAPNLPVRNLVSLPLPYNVTKAGPSSRFTVLSYNMLADLYAKVSRSSWC